jgi:hypothetical protein
MTVTCGLHANMSAYVGSSADVVAARDTLYVCRRCSTQCIAASRPKFGVSHVTIHQHKEIAIISIMIDHPPAPLASRSPPLRQRFHHRRHCQPPTSYHVVASIVSIITGIITIIVVTRFMIIIIVIIICQWHHLYEQNDHCQCRVYLRCRKCKLCPHR